jgi:hypothetical protein
MKAQVLTVVFSVIFGISTVFSANNTGKDPVTNQNNTFQCAIYKSSTNIVTLNMVKPAGENIVVKVYSENGNLMSYKKLKRVDSARIRFDLSPLPKGNYIFKVVEGDQELYIKQIAYDGGKA